MRLVSICLTAPGFSIVLGESDGWMVFQAHVVPSRVALSADADGHFLVGTSHIVRAALHTCAVPN
jgi:hypothetical protein